MKVTGEASTGPWEPLDDNAPLAKAPSDDETDVPGQLIHWLFAMGDTLPTNLFRALALLATHRSYLPAMRKAV